ncbi:MAG: xanthine dehydrogenase family protein molybdopterin-binding subunit [Bacteroidales bacterium]|nr:xanthine dehydrogenase family protein molybdopterin-binding subunit [Bacteroidales bacterium]
MKIKKIKMPHGIPDYNLATVEREVPATEPPAWEVNDKLKVVGKRIKRTDALAKVTGTAVFTADVQLPGMLYGKMFRAGIPHAKIKSIDVSAAQNYPGVFAVHVLEEMIEGANPKSGEKSSRYPDIKYAGQPIAGLAAVSADVAEEAIRLIKVEYEALDFVVDLDEARKPGAPVVFATDVDQEASDGGEDIEQGLKSSGNVRGPSTRSFYGGPRGDLEKGFAEAELIIERTYRTQVQTHCPLETHGVVVDYNQGDVTVFASTQSTKNTRNDFAKAFGLPKSRVRVISEYTGGGFGAKHALGNFGVMAGHLSKISGRPVKLMLDRKEEHISAGNRPNSVQFMKLGAKKDGMLTALKQLSYGTAGVGLGAGVGRIAQAMYDCPNFKTGQYDVFTNAGPGAAFRAPGNVQGAFALEQLIDELAVELDMDPLALREKIDKSMIRKVERERGARRFGWTHKKAGSDKGPVKKGIGVAQAHWPRIVNLDSTVEVRVMRDGAVEVRSAVQDIGTGTKTVLAQVVAEELGLQTEDVTVLIGDTLFPIGPSSGGSIVTGAITPAARNAAYKMKQKLFELAAEKLETDAGNILLEAGTFALKNDAEKKISFKDLLRRMRVEQLTETASRSDDYGGFMVGTIGHGELGSVQFAEVSVDTETGFVQVERMVAAHSCGRPINIGQIESQINGGIIMGIAYALYEDRVIDKSTGHQLNPNIDQYKMPFSFEVPDIQIELIEDYGGRSSTDASGIGEPANIATAPAVANAIYNAIGVRIYDLPITPAKIIAALNNAKNKNDE